MYKPSHAQTMSELDTYQIRLALQGATGTGKTYSALTFPNPVVIDIDQNLTAHKHRTDVIVLPFNDKEWLSKWFKPKKNYAYPIRDAVIEWIKTEGMKLEKDQTLFLDSWTEYQDNFDMQIKLEPTLTSSGGVDAYAPWQTKIEYSRELLTLLKSLKCHVVVSYHEQDTKDANGQRVGKIEPLMSGKFQKKLGLYFTDWFRTCATGIVDPTDKKKIVGCKYEWQTKSDSEVNLKSRLDLPMFIEPSFSSLKKYFEQ